MGTATLDGHPRLVLHAVPRILPVLVLLALVVGAAGGCQGGPNAHYVGTWRSAQPDTLGMRYTFRADGTARIIERPRGLEPQAYEARYEIVGDSILMLRDQIDDARFRVRLQGDTLRLENPATGQQNVWVRL